MSLKIKQLAKQISVLICADGIGIYADKHEVVKWSKDEWAKDDTLTPIIANAIHIANTDPERLIRMMWTHIESQNGT